jgi:uncharacterized protein (TIGR00369 family)
VDPLDEDLRRLLGATPLYVDMGIDLLRAEPGLVALSLVPVATHANAQGLVHGGLLALMADTAMGLAVRTQLPAGLPHVTASLGMRFLRPARADGGSLTVTGRTTKVGRTLAFALAEIVGADGSLIATGDATLSVVERPA